MHCVDAQKANVLRLLMQIGTTGRCSDCGAAIFWVKHRSASTVAYNPYGLDHTAECPGQICE
ncbi:MAG: hypothetical protein ABI811_09860 [Acidobacteriota bacterium]